MAKKILTLFVVLTAVVFTVGCRNINNLSLEQVKQKIEKLEEKSIEKQVRFVCKLANRTVKKGVESREDIYPFSAWDTDQMSQATATVNTYICNLFVRTLMENPNLTDKLFDSYQGLIEATPWQYQSELKLAVNNTTSRAYQELLLAERYDEAEQLSEKYPLNEGCFCKELLQKSVAADLIGTGKFEQAEELSRKIRGNFRDRGLEILWTMNIAADVAKAKAQKNFADLSSVKLITDYFQLDFDEVVDEAKIEFVTWSSVEEVVSMKEFLTEKQVILGAMESARTFYLTPHTIQRELRKLELFGITPYSEKAQTFLAAALLSCQEKIKELEAHNFDYEYIDIDSFTRMFIWRELFSKPLSSYAARYAETPFENIRYIRGVSGQNLEKAIENYISEDQTKLFNLIMAAELEAAVQEWLTPELKEALNRELQESISRLEELEKELEEIFGEDVEIVILE